MQFPRLTDIQRRRKLLGMTQNQLAKQVNISQSLLTKVERGLVVPSYEIAMEIFGILESLESNDQLMAKDAMHAPVIALRPSDTVQKAIGLVKRHTISQFPVVEGHRLVGSVASIDLISKSKNAKIGEILEEPFATVNETTPLRIDCAILRELGIIRDFEQYSHRIWCVRSMELNGIRVSNSLMGWMAARDKLGSFAILSRNGLPIPDTSSSESFIAGYNAVKKFKKAVVKPQIGSRGLGIFLVDNPDVAVHIFSYLMNLSKPVYVQKFLEKKGGGDYRVIVVGGKVIGAEFRESAFWKSNVAAGAKPKAAKLTPEVTEIAIRATEALGLDYAGVDIADTKEGYFVLEVNPSVTWTGFKKATGVNPAIHIVNNLLERMK